MPRPLADTPDARDLASCEADARSVVNAWALGGGALRAITGNRLALGAADLAMIDGVARAFGIRNYALEAAVAIVGAALARDLADLLPDFGSALLRSTLHAATTKLVGEAVITHFRDQAASMRPAPPSTRLRPGA